MATHALDRHLVLVGFMGAGKTTVGAEVARRLGRAFVELDAELGDARAIFAGAGEAEFRRIETLALAAALDRREPAVIELGGGGVETAAVRELLRHELVVHLDVDLETAWGRVRGSERPLAQDEAAFGNRYAMRAPLYAEVADALAHDADGVVLAAAGVHVEAGAVELLAGLVPGDGAVALLTEPVVAGIHGADVQLALGGRLAETHELPTGERAKSVQEVERIWRALRIGKGGTVLALGGGALTDAAGFAAATFGRGSPWLPIPTSLVGQVDAAIGGKTGIDLPEGKNLVGAFHWPVRTVIDPALLETLPAAERLNGMAEVVKTGLLAGEPFWELPDADLVRRCAAFKSAVCLRDPFDRGQRHILNLGHTFAHALESAAGYELPHGRAVALGLLAALRLSGRPTDVVEETLAPQRARVDPGRAWQALLRDKKGRLRIVLLGDDGAFETELPEPDVRSALDELVER
ncbi:MAG: bifunctional shikimate kinase/3-dehydroquinate synthase [Gaiellaceae bacterium]